jgi:hypothetical protein
MTTVINNPGGTANDGGNGMGVLIAVIVLIVIVALFFVFGLPYLRAGARPSGGTNVTVPDKINVDVNIPKY